MKLLVDSGATKADWIALDDAGNRLFTTQTLGLSPEVINKEEALERLEARFDIYNNRKEVTHLYFYGAGCGTDRMKNYITGVFKEFFPNAEVSVKEDTYAAAYATNPNNEKAIVCILGTGSNCSYFDGEKLEQKVQSLGYIAMDDCSGNRFGRDLVRAYFFNKMPKHLAEQFESEYNLDADIIKHNLYKEPNPNAYLATFAKFLIQHKEELYGLEIMNEASKYILLTTLDQVWKEHLHNLDYLRQGISLRAYGQKDPLSEYKREAFNLFEKMLDHLREVYIQRLCFLHMDTEHINRQAMSLANKELQAMQTGRIDPAFEKYNSGISLEAKATPFKSYIEPEQRDPNDPETWGKISRNELCPCGSGKKYKHCHGTSLD